MTMMGSWSGMRKFLEQEMLASSLRGRIRYSCTTYPSMDGWHCFGIHIDGQPYKYFSGESVAKSAYDGRKPFDSQRFWHGYWETIKSMPLSERQEYDDEEFAGALRQYRSLPIGDALVSCNPLVRMFAILDRRVGKRTLARQNLLAQPPWLQGLYQLRMDAEHI